MPPIINKIFNKGLITKIEDKDQARGSASSCLNWHFLGDRIELRRGKVLLGTEVAGTGRITGVKVGKRHDGHEVLFYSYARKFLYIDEDDEETSSEISSNVLPSSADGDDITFSQYSSLAGKFMYASSPNSSIYKIPIANPGSVVDLISNTYRGKMRIKQSRMFLWDRKDAFGGSDKTGLYLSFIDQGEANYDFTSGEELATGDGTTQAFSGTLAFKASDAKETCFFIVIAGAKTAATNISNITAASSAVVSSTSHGLAVGDTVVFADVVGMTQINKRIGVVLTVPDANSFSVNIDSTNFTAYSSGGTVAKAERFIDDRSGNLTGQDGGTGTINYATGAYSITFNVAVINNAKVVAQYYREDSTDDSLADFGFSSPREAGEGNVLRQDDNGPFMNLFSLENVEYCMHESKTWAVTIPPADDTDATNVIYREGVGIPYFRAGVETGEGIYYVDVRGKEVAVRVLDYGTYLDKVKPRSISDQLDFSAYEFDTAVMFEFGDYICLSCRTVDSTINNRLFMYHRTWKSWEVHNFHVSDMDIFKKALVAGDSGSSNVFKLFSGLTDEEANIENHFITNNDFLNKEGVKVTNRMKVAGYIGIDQEIEVSYSVDNESFVVVKTISGNGSYVDLSQRKVIGSTLVGEDEIGGGQAEEDAIYASPYEVEFHVGTPRFERVRIKFEAKGIGYASVSEYGFVDTRNKGRKLPAKYISS